MEQLNRGNKQDNDVGYRELDIGSDIDELLAKGEEVSYDDVLADMIERDRADMTRETDPLKKADDAIEIDTSDMTIDEVVDAILDLVKKAGYVPEGK